MKFVIFTVFIWLCSTVMFGDACVPYKYSYCVSYQPGIAGTTGSDKDYTCQCQSPSKSYVETAPVAAAPVYTVPASNTNSNVGTTAPSPTNLLIATIVLPPGTNTQLTGRAC